MEDFRSAQAVRLRNLHDQYLVAKDDKETVFLGHGCSSSAWWSVEFILKSNSVRLKSHHGKYLAASDQLSFLGMTGCKVLQSLPPLLDSSLELEPVMEGPHVMLRTHYSTFLRANGGHHHHPNSITHDLKHHSTILWNVEVCKREDGFATVRSPETGEGSCVTRSPRGFRYRHHFWKLKSLILDKSRWKDVLVRGGEGTTALVREVCADVQEHFDTIAWISIPRKNDSELSREGILPQLIFERGTFPEDFERNQILRVSELSFQQKARCLIVVDNLKDKRTRRKFEEISPVVEKCQVIFISRPEMGSSDSQIDQYGHESKTYELEHLSYVPPSYHLRNFPEVGFPSSPKGFSQLIARKCEGLQTATVSILCQRGWWPSDSSELKDEWEAWIPSYRICRELNFVQQVFGTLYRHLHRDKGHELDRIQRVSEILCQDDHLFCFLCLSIFPENSQINCQRISCLWAAEGFLPDLGRAEHFMNDLLGRECIHPVKERSDGELHTFRLDKHVREIIVSLSRSCELLKISRQESTHSPGRVRLLHVKGKMKGLNTERTFTLSWTFMLDVSSNEDKIATYEAWPLETSNTPLSPVNLKHSKVLVLTGTPFQTIPNALFELSDVRYLSLGNTSVKAIPGSIGKLTHLEFLDAKHSLITKLPQQVERLKKIRHIRIYHHKKDPLMESYNLIGFKASCSIRGLEHLEKLCFVESDYSILEDLGNLTKLRQLGITKLRNGHGELFCSSLKKLEGLKSLNVHAFDEDEIIDILLLSSPPKYLKHLYLHGRLERLPDWISSLYVLTKIILRGSQLEEDLLAALGKLPELVELELRRAYNGTQLDFKNEQFPKLKILLLDELKGLRSMSLEQGTMPRLENLTISCCQWLERIPSGIEHITAIRKLTFFDMPHEFYEMIPADYENDRYLEHIREVYFTQWVSGHRETHQFDRVTRAWQVNTE